MKKQCLFTPEQKQILLEYNCDIACKFGRFFWKNGFLEHWTQSDIVAFKSKLKNNPILSNGKQLGILFAYHISTKNIDYFIKNRTYDFQKYFSIKTSKGWNGFAYYIYEQLQKMQNEQEIREFFENLYNKIFD